MEVKPFRRFVGRKVSGHVNRFPENLGSVLFCLNVLTVCKTKRRLELTNAYLQSSR